MTADAVPENTRRLRPWIAALLTLIFGWGVGLFYARRTKAAIWWAVIQMVVSIAVGVALIGYMLATSSAPRWLFNPDGLGITDAISWALSAVMAIFVWIVVAKRKHAKRAGPVRLLGYLAIWLAPIAMAFVIALALRLYMQPFRIPSGSMQPTLHVGDYILVSKTAYGYGPYTTAPFTGIFPQRSADRLPQRGDIAVLRPVHEPDRDFVERVVGLPGERIQMIDGVLHINGAPVQMESLGEMAFEDFDGAPARIPAYRETLPGGVSHTIFDRDPRSPLDNTREYRVPEGHYFVMGDDRDHSDDSRASVGYVPLDNFIGRVDRILRGQDAS